MRKPFKTQNAAVTAAFFISPIAPGFFLPLVGRWKFPPDWTGMLVIYTGALPFCFVIGLPLFLLFSKLRIFSWWGSVLGGVLGAVAILGAIMALVGGRHSLQQNTLLLYAAAGAATGLVFWAVVMLGPEPSQSTARNWVESYRPRRKE
jgi:hypothetical protein